MSDPSRNPSFWKVGTTFVNLGQVLDIEVLGDTVKLRFPLRSHELNGEDAERLLEYLDRVKVGPPRPAESWANVKPANRRL